MNGTRASDRLQPPNQLRVVFRVSFPSLITQTFWISRTTYLVQQIVMYIYTVASSLASAITKIERKNKTLGFDTSKQIGAYTGS